MERSDSWVCTPSILRLRRPMLSCWRWRIQRLRMAVPSGVAGVEHVGDEGQSVHVALAHDVEVFVCQLHALLLCAQLCVGLLQVDVSFVYGVFQLFLGQAPLFFLLLYADVGLSQLAFSFEQGVDVVGDAYAHKPVGEVVVEGRHFDEDGAVELVGGR